MKHAPIRTFTAAAGFAALSLLAAGCGSDASVADTDPTGTETAATLAPETTVQPAPDASTAPVPSSEPAATTSAPDAETTAPAEAATAIPGGNVTPDNPDDPDPEDPPGTGTIPARMVVDGQELEANACEVVPNVIRVRAGDGVTDTGVVVTGAADSPSMTLLNLTGGVDAESVEFEPIFDDADQYTGVFDPSLTEGITDVRVSFNLGVLPCPDSVQD